VISSADFNADALKDLYVFDKASGQSHVFINHGSTTQPVFEYDPSFDSIFPRNIDTWVLLRDFNQDGIPDLFYNSHDSLYSESWITCYRGKYQGGKLRFDLYKSKLTQTQNLPHLPIEGRRDYLPALADVNRDGDMDILFWNPSLGLTIIYYENQAVEDSVSLDSLRFGIDICGTAWGMVQKDSRNGSLLLNAISCKRGIAGPRPTISQGAGRHALVGSIFTYDSDNDGLIDALTSDAGTPTVAYLHNKGTLDKAQIVDFDTLFPSYGPDISMPLYANSYGADINNDGREDLLVAPFLADLYQHTVEDIKCIQYHTNQALPNANKFTFTSNTFLTDATVDVGSLSCPRYLDVNHDGLLDIVIGSFNTYSNDSNVAGKLSYLKNIGTPSLPHFVWQTDDFCHWAAFGMYGVQPAFGDLDGDSLPDALVGDSSGHLHFFKNSGDTTTPYPTITASQYFNLAMRLHATPYIYDLNGDSLPDIIVGSNDGRISYFKNIGTRTAPSFSMAQANLDLGRIRIPDRTNINRPLPGYSSPMVTREQGTLVLYTGSRQGYIYRYVVNKDSLYTGSFLQTDSQYLGYQMGMYATIDAADINHDSYPDYLVGNVSGGMSLYAPVYWGDTSLHDFVPVSTGLEQIFHTDDSLVIFPNPAHDKITCFITGNRLYARTIILTDMMGRLVHNYTLHDNSEMVTFGTAELTDGMYQVSVLLSDGTVVQRKLSIIK
jgi:hypothetical protein